jgi:hypothetical protein
MPGRIVALGEDTNNWTFGQDPQDFGLIILRCDCHRFGSPDVSPVGVAILYTCSSAMSILPCGQSSGISSLTMTHTS